MSDSQDPHSTLPRPIGRNKARALDLGSPPGSSNIVNIAGKEDAEIAASSAALQRLASAAEQRKSSCKKATGL